MKIYQFSQLGDKSAECLDTTVDSFFCREYLVISQNFLFDF